MTTVKEFFYILKVCGLRWFVWFLPFPLVIVVMQCFGSQEKFNDKFVNAVRLGNSGVFLIYSKEIQDKISKNMRNNETYDEQYRRSKLRSDYEKEFGVEQND